MKFLFVSLFVLTAVFMNGQDVVYPLNSLTTVPAIPRKAVNIPAGRPSGPDARLLNYIYSRVRFPRTALTTRTSGKAEVYGTVDTAGVFMVDSVGLFSVQAVIDLNDDRATPKREYTSLGVVHEFERKKNKVKLLDAPNQWSKAQEDIVLEAVRLANLLPQFKPGTIDGQRVRSFYSFPVLFLHK